MMVEERESPQLYEVKVDYTREPVIETVITPSEGCKLVVRNSKVGGQEEYLVDSVEMVSFGNALFFRSIERPKAFLVPVNDYEVIELKETKMVLKSVSIEKAIKIGGGKEAAPEEEKRMDRKKERRKSRRRRLALEREGERRAVTEETPTPSSATSGVEKVDIENLPTPPPPPRKILPPPSTLIKEKLKIKKEEEGPILEENSFAHKQPGDTEKTFQDLLPPGDELPKSEG